MAQGVVGTLLRVYGWVSSQVESVIQQVDRTFKAVFGSFEDEELLFLDTAFNLAIRKHAIANLKAVPLHVTWSYTNDVFKHTNTTQAPQGFPWLSIELKKDTGATWDLTMWLEKKKFSGDTCPTADIVVQTWAIETGESLAELRHYTVKVLNELAEEEVLPVLRTI